MRIASFLLSSTGLAAVTFAAETGTGAGESTIATEEVKTPKSVVPAKYAGKYKGGGSGAVPDFIKSQSYENGAIVLESFFSLCKVNEIPDEKIEHYRNLVAEKAQGAAGKARMTLGNMLAAKARKNGFLLNQAGEQVALDVPKPALSGAAAKAAEGVQTNGTADETTGTTSGTVNTTEVDDAEDDGTTE